LPGPERPQIVPVILGRIEIPYTDIIPGFDLERPDALDQGEQRIFPCPKGSLDQRDEAPRVNGEEGFQESSGIDGNDDVTAVGLPDERPEEPNVDVGDVAGEDSAGFVAGRLQPGKDPRHGPQSLDYVYDGPAPWEGLGLSPRNGDQDLIEKAFDLGQDPLNHGSARERQAGLICPHPPALAARQDDQRDRTAGTR